jgi:hypothetical protein
MISRMTDEQIIERFEENERAIAEYKKQLDALREDFKTLLWYSAPGDLALKQVKTAQTVVLRVMLRLSSRDAKSLSKGIDKRRLTATANRIYGYQIKCHASRHD